MPQFVVQRHNIFRMARWEQANRWSHRECTDTGASNFEVKSKPMAVAPQGHNIAASYIDCESKLNSGCGQWGPRHRGRAPKLFWQQASSSHSQRRLETAVSYTEQQAGCSQGQQGHKTSGMLIIILKASRMVVVPQGHLDIAGELLFCFIAWQQAKWRSRHEGTDIAGELIVLFFISQQAEWRSCHEGTDITGELIILFLFHSKLNGGRSQWGRETVGELCGWWKMCEKPCRRGSRAQTISTILCRRGSRNSSSCLAK